MANDIPDQPRRLGRPRKYASDAERIRAFRSLHGLSKVTVDVPVQFAGELRDYARELRRVVGDARITFDADLVRRDMSQLRLLAPKEAAESYVMRMRWARTASGAHHLYGPPPHWIEARVIKIPRRRDPQLWSWHVDDNRSMKTIARGDAINLGKAKGMIIAVVKWYLEEEYSSKP